MAEAGQLIRNKVTKANNRGSQIYIKAMSASCLLDRKIESRSFQNTAKTYGEVVRENVQTDGGQVIRNQETDKKIGCPVIRCEETTWQFANCMARRLGNYIIPDVETGNPNLWFGMRNGKGVSTLPEAQCVIQMNAVGKDIGIRFKAEGRNFYKIGDRMEYLGQNVTIVEVEGRYQQKFHRLGKASSSRHFLKKCRYSFYRRYKASDIFLSFQFFSAFPPSGFVRSRVFANVSRVTKA